MLKTGFTVILALIMTSGIAFANAGDLDTSFNSPTGYVLYEPGLSGSAIAIQPDGKLVVAGTIFNGMNEDVLVLRYYSNGLLDTSFGKNGIVTYDGGYIDKGSAVAIQPDGRIVVVGSSHNGFNSYNVLVLRYNSDGTPDTSFGTKGAVIYNGTVTDATDFGNAVAIQPDGKIVVAGSTADHTRTYLLVLRYQSDGALDGTFGANGIVSYNFITTNMVISDDYARALAIQPDGKIVVAGSTRSGADPEHALILRLNSDGVMDTNFGGGDGAVTFDSANRRETANAVALQKDGRIVVVGNLNNLILALRYNTNGTLDQTFGEKGVVIYAGQNPAAGQYNNAGNAVVIQPDGKIVLGGSSALGMLGHLLVLRYQGDGTPDQSFGSGGQASFQISAQYSDGVTSMAIQPDGRIVIAGSRLSQTGDDADVLVMRIMGQEFMALPDSQQFFSYPPTVLPAMNMDPSLAQPIGVGPVALTGGNTLRVRVGLLPLMAPADLYVGIFAPSIDSATIYILRSDYSFQAASLGLVPWKTSTGPLDESLFGGIPIVGLPHGTYYLYVAMTPLGNTTHFYLWLTWFTVP